MADKAVHQMAAEAVVAKVPAAQRSKLTVMPKSSYSVVADADSWLVRLTPKVIEVAPHVDMTKVAEHLGEETKPRHFRHDITVQGEGDDRQVAAAEKEGDEPVVGIPEVAAAVNVAAKAKREPKAKPAKAEKAAAETPEK